MPSSGTMYWWRFKGAPTPWKFGYCTHTNTSGLVRMGAYNGDQTGGSVVDVAEIEWKTYNG